MYIVKSGYCNIDGVGRVYVSVRSNATSVRARWKGGEIYVSAPLNMEYEQLSDIIRGFMPKLSSMKPESPYRLGQEFDFGEFGVKITGQTHAPTHILANFNKGLWTISVGSEVDITSKSAVKAISRYMCRMAQHAAPSVLIPRGIEIASKLGLSPSEWRISSGQRTLGRCSSKGVICLSYSLMFYPPHLRDYVICHELAHLSEMNHSQMFHKVCDLYCGGNEKKLEAELRAFKMPVV